MKISDDDPRAREDDLRVGRAALSLEAEVRKVDALVDALRGMCDGASESDGDGPGFSDEVNEVDESDASFRSAEEEPAGGDDDDEEKDGCGVATWSPDTVLRPESLFDESPSPTADHALRRQSSVTFDDDRVTVHDIGSVKDLRREKRTSIAGAILEWVKADVRGFVEGALALGRRRKDSAEEAESAKATRKSLRESRRNMYVNVDNATYGYRGHLGDPDFTFV